MFNQIIYDYYWRDYTSGDIPFDAFMGGHSDNNKPIYIGQVCVQKYGIIPVMIHPGKKSVAAPINGLNEIIELDKEYIKILCSPCEENFRWVPTNAKILHLESKDKYLIPGGIEEDSVINIGRVSIQHKVFIGKVHGKGEVKMYFSSETKEESVDEYEVLTFVPKQSQHFPGASE